MQGYQYKKIWDPVTRVWHWVLALAVMITWGLGKFMELDTIQWHFTMGYTVLGLMVFRLLWGFVGPAPVRYSAILPTPSATLRYLKTLGRREPSGSPGHNPLGSLSVIAMLIVITAQPLTGLFTESEDFFEDAQLAAYVSQSTVNRMTWWHHYISDIVLILVVLHVAAILFYLVWKRENLIKPMISGWKWVRGRG